MDTPCDICGDPRHDYRNCTKEAYRKSQDVRQSPASERGPEDSAQTVISLTRECALVHGVINLAT